MITLDSAEKPRIRQPLLPNERHMLLVGGGACNPVEKAITSISDSAALNLLKLKRVSHPTELMLWDLQPDSNVGLILFDEPQKS